MPPPKKKKKKKRDFVLLVKATRKKICLSLVCTNIVLLSGINQSSVYHKIFSKKLSASVFPSPSYWFITLKNIFLGSFEQEIDTSLDMCLLEFREYFLMKIKERDYLVKFVDTQWNGIRSIRMCIIKGVMDPQHSARG